MRKIALCIAVAVAGCGGDSVPLSELGSEMGKTICAKMVECCTAEELMDELLGATNQTECEELYNGLIGGLVVPQLEDSVASGRMRYDGGRMAECLDDLAAIECSELRGAIRGGPGTSCADPFTGLVDIGGACAGDVDCISSFCNGDSLDFEGNVMFGVCAQLPSDGQPCVDDTCGPGLRCDRQLDTCAPALADGMDCTFDDDCASGDCVDSTTGNGTCGRTMTCDGQ
jgi:hypothetical protein